jgi:hypothetical protein
LHPLLSPNLGSKQQREIQSLNCIDEFMRQTTKYLLEGFKRSHDILHEPDQIFIEQNLYNQRNYCFHTPDDAERFCKFGIMYRPGGARSWEYCVPCCNLSIDDPLPSHFCFKIENNLLFLFSVLILEWELCVCCHPDLIVFTSVPFHQKYA